MSSLCACLYCRNCRRDKTFHISDSGIKPSRLSKAEQSFSGFLPQLVPTVCLACVYLFLQSPGINYHSHMPGSYISLKANVAAAHFPSILITASR